MFDLLIVFTAFIALAISGIALWQVLRIRKMLIGNIGLSILDAPGKATVHAEVSLEWEAPMLKGFQIQGDSLHRQIGIKLINRGPKVYFIKAAAAHREAGYSVEGGFYDHRGQFTAFTRGSEIPMGKHLDVRVTGSEADRLSFHIRVWYRCEEGLKYRQELRCFEEEELAMPKPEELV